MVSSLGPIPKINPMYQMNGIFGRYVLFKNLFPAGHPHSGTGAGGHWRLFNKVYMTTLVLTNLEDLRLNGVSLNLASPESPGAPHKAGLVLR